MVNLIPIGKKFEEYKANFIEFAERYFAEEKEALRRNVEKELMAEAEQKLKEFEKLLLSESTAKLFKKIIQMLEELENMPNLRESKCGVIAERYDVSDDVARIVINMVRYKRLYDKFMNAKNDLFRFV